MRGTRAHLQYRFPCSPTSDGPTSGAKVHGEPPDSRFPGGRGMSLVLLWQLVFGIQYHSASKTIRAPPATRHASRIIQCQCQRTAPRSKTNTDLGRTKSCCPGPRSTGLSLRISQGLGSSRQTSLSGNGPLYGGKLCKRRRRASIPLSPSAVHKLPL